MPSYVTPKKGVEYIFYIGLTDQANTKLLKANPTIAAGDFKVSIDGGAFNNPATLPAVTPAAGKGVKCVLSTSEMNGDNIIFLASDAAGDEWCDQIINIQTSARQIDDLAFPTTAGRSIDVTTNGGVGIDWANVENPTTALALTGTSTKSLQPTVAGRTLDVTATGGAGIDWANVENPTTTLALTGTTIAGAPATLSPTERNLLADAMLVRAFTSVTPQPALNDRNMLTSMRAIRNKTEIAANVLTVYEEDDAAISWTAILTLNSAAQPVIGVDPA